MSNPLEQLELKANLTLQERAYFDKLKAEYQELYGGRTLTQIGEEGDVVALQQIEEKLEAMKRFLERREMGVEIWDRERFDGWVHESHLEYKLTNEWIDENVRFENGRVVCDKSLDLEKTIITYLPNNLQVQGDLSLSYCTGLTALTDNLQVAGSLSLGGCTGLTTLPDNLQVQGVLWLNGCTGLTTLPDNLHIKEYLSLEGCTALTTLPGDLNVKGFLSLDGCTALTTLPDNLQVQGDLFLRYCTALTTLPDNLEVKRDVHTDGLPELTIKKLHELNKKGQIKGKILP